MSRNAALTAFLVLAVVILYWPATVLGGVFFQRDIYNYWRPHISWALASLASGETIGWNPGTQFGAPFLSDPNFQIFYPPTWLLVLMPPERYYTILVTGHAVLAGLGVACLLRSYDLGKGVYAGAVAMALSGPFVSMANLWHHYCGVAWIPWVVWAVRRLALTGGESWRSLAALLGLQALAGSAEGLVMSALLAGLTQWPAIRGRRVASRLIAATLVGACIAAIQWAPTMALFASSARKELSLGMKLGWSLPPEHSLQLVVAGDPRTREVLFNNTASALEDTEIPFIIGPYLGAFAFPLFLLGIRRLPGFLFVGLAALFGSFGRYLPAPVPLWLTVLPFRYPTKALALVAVSYAVLVGAGTHVLLTRPESPRHSSSARRAFGVVVALVIATAISGAFVKLPGTPLSRMARSALFLTSGLLATTVAPGVPWILAAGIFVDAKSGVSWVNDYADPSFFRFRPPVVDVVQRLGPHPRIFVAYTGEIWAQADLNERGLKSDTAFQASLGEVLFPPHGLRFGIRHGFQPDFTGLGVPEMQAFEKFLDKRFRADIRRYLDLGAIDAVISAENNAPLREGEPLARFEGITSSPTRVERWGKTPRAGLARRAVVTGTLEESLNTVGSEGFQPGRDTALQDPSRKAGTEESLSGGLARLVIDRNDRVDVEVTTAGPGVLVLRDSIRAGWSATVNDVPEPILRADVIMRAVRVPAGHSVVSFRYFTPGLAQGLALGLVGLLLLLWPRGRAKVRS